MKKGLTRMTRIDMNLIGQFELLEIGAISVSVLVWNLCASVSICGPNLVLKSQNSRKTSGNQSRLFEPIRRYFREKNSEFFYGHFYRKSLGMLAKTAQKTLQNSPKKRAIFDVFFCANFSIKVKPDCGLKRL
jgi:hypothetical protein